MAAEQKGQDMVVARDELRDWPQIAQAGLCRAIRRRCGPIDLQVPA